MARPVFYYHLTQFYIPHFGLLVCQIREIRYERTQNGVSCNTIHALLWQFLEFISCLPTTYMLGLIIYRCSLPNKGKDKTFIVGLLL